MPQTEFMLLAQRCMSRRSSLSSTTHTEGTATDDRHQQQRQPMQCKARDAAPPPCVPALATWPMGLRCEPASMGLKRRQRAAASAATNGLCPSLEPLLALCPSPPLFLCKHGPPSSLLFYVRPQVACYIVIHSWEQGSGEATQTELLLLCAVSHAGRSIWGVMGPARRGGPALSTAHHHVLRDAVHLVCTHQRAGTAGECTCQHTRRGQQRSARASTPASCCR